MPPGFRVLGFRMPGAIYLPMPIPPGYKDKITAAQKKFVDRQKEAKASGGTGSISAAKDAAINDYILEVNQAWSTMPRSPGQTTLDIARDEYTAGIRKALASRASDGGQAAIYKAWYRYERQEAIAMVQIGMILREPEQAVWREVVERHYDIKIGMNGQGTSTKIQPQQSRASGGSGTKASQSQNVQKPSSSAAKPSAGVSGAKGTTKEAKIGKAEAFGSGTPKSGKASNAGSAAGTSGGAKSKPKETKAGISNSGTPKSVQASGSGSTRAKFGFTPPGGPQISGTRLGSLEKQKNGSQNPHVFPGSEMPSPGSGSGRRSSQAVPGSGGKGSTKKETPKEPKGTTKDAKTKEKSKHVGFSGSESGSRKEVKGSNTSSLGRNQAGDMNRTLVEGMVEKTPYGGSMNKTPAGGSGTKKKSK